MRAKHIIQRRKRPFRQAALHVEHGPDAERPGDRQQKPQGRAAFAAVKLTPALRRACYRADLKAPCARRLHMHTQRRKAARRRLYIGGNAVAFDSRLPGAERGAYEQPVRL